MNRISTPGSYSAVLANLMAAQQRQQEAGNRVSTQKNGSDLKDYAKNAEVLTAMRTVDSRLTSYTEQNKLVADKLTTQDTSLTQVKDAAANVRDAIAQALASGRGDTLMQDIGGYFQDAVQGLNARYNGKYLYSGGKLDTAPVNATSLADMTNPAKPAITDFFDNDKYVTQAKVDDNSTVATGVLASNVGTNLMSAFKDLQSFVDSSGAFTGDLTDAQKSFLEGQLANWDTVGKGLVDTVARNGIVQKRVDSVSTDISARQDSLTTMIGGVTDADMAKAYADLEQAQVAVQASAQVFQTLQNTSLLNVLQ
jgi:flagellar hook-associated protein 3 FlgL